MKSIASQKALELLQEDCFWDFGNEFAPFGSDEGSDCVTSFYKWKQENPSQKNIVFFNKQIINHRPYQDVLDKQVLEIEDADLLSKEQLMYFCEDIDDEIIAIGFGQIVLEGTIDPDIKHFTIKAIKRQLSERCFQYWQMDKDCIQERTSILHKELEVLAKI